MDLDLISVIVFKTYNKYGKTTIFREYDFTTINYNKTTYIYRVQSAINYPYLYEIQIHAFDKVTKINTVCYNFLRKCKYCSIGYCDYKMKCCGKYLHLTCGIKNNFACCELNNILNKNNYNDECCICFDSCNTKTQCGHSVCSSCINEIASKNQQIECPLCRNFLYNQTEEYKCDEFFNVKMNDLVARVRVCFI